MEIKYLSPIFFRTTRSTRLCCFTRLFMSLKPQGSRTIQDRNMYVYWFATLLDCWTMCFFSISKNYDIVKNCLRIFMLYHCRSKGLSNCSRRVGNTLTRRTPTGHTGQSYLIAITVDTAWYIWFFLYRCKKRETKMNMTHEVINTIRRWCAWNCDAKVCFLLKLWTLNWMILLMIPSLTDWVLNYLKWTIWTIL